MHPRLDAIFLLIALFLVIPFLSHPQSAEAAAGPGETLLSRTGTLSPGQTAPMTVFSDDLANIRLIVRDGDAGDTITLKLLDSAGALQQSWNAQSGETIWASAQLQTRSKLTLQNASAKPLSYELVAYAVGVAPQITESTTTWSGVSRGAGMRSFIQLTAPTAGLYRLTMGSGGGSFQVSIDSNYVLKTLVAGSGAASAESVHYLSAGNHTLTIVQDPAAALVNWNIGLTPQGGIDTLPNEERGALGGAPFTEEWIPLQVEAAGQVNLNIAVAGAPADSLVVELYNASRATPVFTSATIFGGETTWGSSALTAGANALRVVTSGSGGLTYTLTVNVIASAPTTVTGTNYGAPAHPSGSNPSLLLKFPASGLYTFNLGASAGRYQMLLGSRYLQKTVTTAGATFTAYVAAGSYPITAVQDPAEPSTSWSIGVAPAAAASDSLPYTRNGGTLGGVENAFTEEWLPLQRGGDSPVNIRISATGTASDSLLLELYNPGAGSPSYSVKTVYGGEVVWGASTLANGTNLLRIVAPTTNTGRMDYQIDVVDVAAIPAAVSGVSMEAGLQSVMRLNAPVAGTYNVTVTVTAGSGQVLIDEPSTSAFATRNIRLNSSSTTLRVPLSAGMHTFTFVQDPGQPKTTWQIDAGLRRADTRRLYLPMTIR
jgi:hypothetical protein